MFGLSWRRKKLCKFCHGIGYLDFGFAEKGTMGERLLNHPNGRLGTDCPVCNEDGEKSCFTCRGNGWIARWRLNNKYLDDVRP